VCKEGEGFLKRQDALHTNGPVDTHPIVFDTTNKLTLDQNKTESMKPKKENKVKATTLEKSKSAQYLSHWTPDNKCNTMQC
jgi:hypothetical protein